MKENSLYKDNGFLSATGQDFVSNLENELKNILVSDRANSMTESELRTLGSTLSSMIGKAVTSKILENKNK